MKRGLALIAACVLALLTVAAAGAKSTGTTITGAGSTFVAPLVSAWTPALGTAFDYNVQYSAVGSGAGIAAITSNQVDFGASDAPLKPEELDKAGLIQFPMVMGGVVPVINIAGVKAGELKLTPAVLAEIFLGHIKKWNDPKLAGDNGGLKLPDTAITVVHRSDGSGTTWIFTNYLTKVSPDWAKTVGNDKSVSWPAGVGGKGNQGVASYVQRINGAIGYVESAYAKENHIAHAKLKNHGGAFVDPSDDSVQAAAKGADWESAHGYYVVLTDQPGPKAWPITGASFVLMHKKQKSGDTARAALRFFDWGYRRGIAAATTLGYVPMPANVIELVEKTWARELSDASGQKVWPADKHAQN